MREFMRQIRYLSLFVCVIPIITFASVPQSDPQEITPTQQPQQEPVLEPIADTDIVHRSDAAGAELKEIRARTSSHTDVIRIKKELPDFIESWAQFQRDSKIAHLDELSLYQLYSLREESLYFRIQSDSWQKTLLARSQALEAEKAELQQMKKQWQLTKEFAVPNNYLDTLIQRINTVLKDIAEVEQALRRRLENIFSLQDRVSSQSMAIAETLNQIEIARMASRERLFAQDGPPLWKTPLFPENEVSFFEELRDIWGEKVNIWKEYFLENRQRLVIYFVFFLALCSILIAVRRTSRKWPEEDQALRASANIFARPVSVALLLTLLMSIWIHPQIPVPVQELVVILMILPLIWFLPGLITPRLRAPLYGLGGLYVLQQIFELLPKNSLLPRLYLLITTSIALVGLIWFMKRIGPRVSAQRGRWMKAISLYAYLCVLLFGVAWIANIFGYASLAVLLTSSTFLSIYTLLIVLVLVMVADGLMVIFLRSKAGQSLRMIRFHQELWERKTKAYLHVAAFFYWIYLILRYFEVFDPVKIFLTDLLGNPLTVGTLHISLGDILAFGITIWVWILLARGIRFVLGEDVLPRLTLPRGVPAAISFTAYYLILIVGFFLALSAAGIEWSRFALLAGALGIGIGFGLQNLVNNFVSGLILIFERPIKLGDTIEFGTLRGIVSRIGLRSSTIHTWKGADVIIPNGNLISSEFTNWTLSDRKRRISIPVGVAYGTDPNQVLQILKAVAAKHPEVLDNPEPDVFFLGFGESSLDFELRFSVMEYGEWRRIKSEIAIGIHNDLKKAQIEIPFPQRDLHVRSLDSEAKKVLSPEPKARTKIRAKHNAK